MTQIKRKLLSACLFTSLCFHIGAIIFFQNYSLAVSGPKNGKDRSVSFVDKKERNQILKETFAPLKLENNIADTEGMPRKEEVPLYEIAAPLPQFEDPANFAILHSTQIRSKEFLISYRALPSFSLPEQELINLEQHLPKKPICSFPNEVKIEPPLPKLRHFVIEVKPKTPQIETNNLSLKYAAALEHIDSTHAEIPELPKSPQLSSLPRFPHLPSLDELETASYSEAFDTELVFIPKGKEGEGYIFALTLIPHPDLELPRIKQHFTFLIDRSNTIQQKRLNATKTAVKQAISEISDEDTFNIVAFDSKIEKMSPGSMLNQGTAQQIANTFLDKIQLGSFFSKSDLFNALFLTVPGIVRDDELHTAILMTDAENLGHKQAQRNLLYNWTAYNNGKVTLYAISLNQDPHLSTLDATAALNQGKLLHSPTERGLKRKLLKLMKTIQSPIAKNISCKAISLTPHAAPKLSIAAPTHIYLDQPTVIFGETDTLDHFILFVQGKLKNKWLNIKKTISFVDAKKGSKSLKGEWALQKAYELYEQYGADGDSKHLTDAAQLLALYDFQVAIQ